MEQLEIGKIIEARRIELGYTQKQLSEDICSQAQLSRIERGLHTPAHEKLQKILARLNLPLNYFDEPENFYSDLIAIKELHRFVDLRKYKEIHDYIEENHLWNKFIDDEKIQLLYYFEGIYASHYLNKQSQALDFFFKGLEQTIPHAISKTHTNLCHFKKVSEEELLIIGAIGASYFILQKYQTAEKYFNFAIEKYQHFYNRQNFEQIAILLYSSAKNYKYLGNYDEAQKNCQKGLPKIIRRFDLLKSILSLEKFSV